MFTKALVPLDGSDVARGILPYILYVAKGLDMPLVLLTVLDPDDADLPESLAAPMDEEGRSREYLPGTISFEPEAVDLGERERRPHPHEAGRTDATEVLENLQTRVRQDLEETARQLAQEHGLKVEARVELGKPADTIVRVAQREGCDLIAMSTHGRNPLARGVLGSVTDRVIHTSHTPVLTITPQRAREFDQGAVLRRLILPLDGSTLAEEAIPYCEALAKGLGLEVILARVTKIGGVYASYMDGYVYATLPDLERQIEAEAVEYLRAVAEKMEAKGVKASVRLLKGAPARALLELADETEQCMVVLTTHGRSGFMRWLLGSVAETLVRASGDPVLVIPPGAQG